MAELFIQIAVSLDGYIEDADRDIGWMTDDGSVDSFMTESLRGIGGMVFGRRAWDLMVQFWPTAADQAGASPDLIAQAHLMRDLPKYVLTRSSRITDWAGAQAISFDDLQALKAEAARPIAVFAGAGAIQAVLSRQGLADELRLLTYPLTLAAGTALFAVGGPRLTLRLEEARSFPSGAVFTRHRLN